MAEVLRHIHGVYRRTEDHDYAKLFKNGMELTISDSGATLVKKKSFNGDWLRGSKCSDLSEKWVKYQLKIVPSSSTRFEIDWSQAKPSAEIAVWTASCLGLLFSQAPMVERFIINVTTTREPLADRQFVRQRWRNTRGF